MTLYDLKVFNYLVMRLDTDQAWEKKAKFNDVLVEREMGVRHSGQNVRRRRHVPDRVQKGLRRKQTLWRWLEKLEKASRIQSVSYMKQIKSEQRTDFRSYT